MTATSSRGLPRTARAFRIGDADGRHEIFSGEGAALSEARWHRAGQRVIYAAEHLSCAMLEKLVHFNGILPANQHFVTLTLPKGLTYEVVTKDSLADWTSSEVSRAFGAAWIEANRSALLYVPSIVVREERNVLINPAHPAFADIDVSLEQPIHWDKRLLGPATPAASARPHGRGRSASKPR
ncbi:MAG: RES domain-containing protein [Pseudomonadota bacterium]